MKNKKSMTKGEAWFLLIAGLIMGGEFIFCVYQSEDAEGNFVTLREEIDLQQLMIHIPDTTTTMYADGRYKDFTKDEFVALSKKAA